MASFPYNSSSLLFQQLRNISSSAGEEANSPQHCSQAGHKWEQKPCKFWLPWIEGACVFIQVNSKCLAITNFPPQVNPSVNIQCQRVALTGWEYMKQKWIFRKSIMALYVPVTNDARSPSLLVNRTPLPQPVSTQHIWACFPLLTPLLFQTSRFHFSSSIQYDHNLIEILTPPHLVRTHHSHCTDLTYGSQMCPALSDKKTWVVSRSQASLRHNEYH